jgi:hypothetical protein
MDMAVVIWLKCQRVTTASGFVLAFMFCHPSSKIKAAGRGDSMARAIGFFIPTPTSNPPPLSRARCRSYPIFWPA